MEMNLEWKDGSPCPEALCEGYLKEIPPRALGHPSLICNGCNKIFHIPRRGVQSRHCSPLTLLRVSEVVRQLTLDSSVFSIDNDVSKLLSPN
eukprot:g36965.t1